MELQQKLENSSAGQLDDRKIQELLSAQNVHLHRECINEWLPSSWTVCVVNVLPDMGGIVILRERAECKPLTYFVPCSNETPLSLLDSFQSLVDAAHSTTKGATESKAKSLSSKEKAKWWKRRRALDHEMMKLLDRLEREVFGAMKVICAGIPKKRSSFHVERVERVKTWISCARSTAKTTPSEGLVEAFVENIDLLSMQEIEGCLESWGINTTYAAEIKLAESNLEERSLSPNEINKMLVKDLRRELSARSMKTSD